MKFSTRADRIEPFYVMEIAKAAQEMARGCADSDTPMIFLNIGEPDFTAPPLVQEAAARAVQDGVLEAEAASDPQQPQRARRLVEAARARVHLLGRLGLEQRAHLVRVGVRVGGQGQG